MTPELTILTLTALLQCIPFALIAIGCKNAALDTPRRLMTDL